ncbi:unnamed protein product [Diamesa serratosioi]
MIVLLNLFVILCVTFTNDVNGERLWQNPVEMNDKDPYLAYITRVNSNLQPIFQPYLGLIYNKQKSPQQPRYAYSNDKQLTRSPLTFTRRIDEETKTELIFHCGSLTCPNTTHKCETLFQSDLENSNRIMSIQCLSITNNILSEKTSKSNQDSSEMFYIKTQTVDDVSHLDELEKRLFSGNVDAIEPGNTFHCNFLTCPSETHSCKSTFDAVSQDVIKMRVTTQCLSITNEVLVERTTISKSPLSGSYYIEFKTVESEHFNDEILSNEPSSGSVNSEEVSKKI